MITIPSARRIASPTELGLSVMFGLTPCQAHLLATMLEGATIRTLRGNIHRLRAALSEEAVDTTEHGYALTEIGKDECDQALVDFRAWVDGEKAA